MTPRAFDRWIAALASFWVGFWALALLAVGYRLFTGVWPL